MSHDKEEKASPENVSPAEREVKGEVPAQLEVRYSKSGSFRAVRADGVYGGILPSLHIHMSFFVERGPVPNKVKYLVSQEGKLEGEASVDIESGIVREVETSIVMDLFIARGFLDWLKEKVDLGEALQKGTAKKEENYGTPESDRFEQS